MSTEYGIYAFQLLRKNDKSILNLKQQKSSNQTSYHQSGSSQPFPWVRGFSKLVLGSVVTIGPDTTKSCHLASGHDATFFSIASSHEKLAQQETNQPISGLGHPETKNLRRCVKNQKHLGVVIYIYTVHIFYSIYI